VDRIYAASFNRAVAAMGVLLPAVTDTIRRIEPTPSLPFWASAETSNSGFGTPPVRLNDGVARQGVLASMAPHLVHARATLEAIHEVAHVRFFELVRAGADPEFVDAVAAKLGVAAWRLPKSTSVSGPSSTAFPELGGTARDERILQGLPEGSRQVRNLALSPFGSAEAPEANFDEFVAWGYQRGFGGGGGLSTEAVTSAFELMAEKRAWDRPLVNNGWDPDVAKVVVGLYIDSLPAKERETFFKRFIEKHTVTNPYQKAFESLDLERIPPSMVADAERRVDGWRAVQAQPNFGREEAAAALAYNRFDADLAGILLFNGSQEPGSSIERPKRFDPPRASRFGQLTDEAKLLTPSKEYVDELGGNDIALVR
jgi:hypothetical protein